ncbi:hypothetical protein A2W56_02980 [Candidatus Nomurabacteria bacterium RIFCSPHIGHO2_02_41_18]|nr:MAG: hypothetical protein A2W56_02980 [Candidatus Nomurabacteria bacterium RIFCSPHIGHO2_02_41_18]
MYYVIDYITLFLIYLQNTLAITFRLAAFFALHLHHGFVFAFIEVKRIMVGCGISAFRTLESVSFPMADTAMLGR